MPVSECLSRYFAVTVALCAASAVLAGPDAPCEPLAQTDAGWVRGLWVPNEPAPYASFRGVPYATQPVGKLRFKELEPVESWQGVYDAFEEGLICHQTDVVYGRLMKPRGMSEECIYANIHVPLDALPSCQSERTEEEPYTWFSRGYVPGRGGLPILVFIHGGGFQGGSGDADLHGPEYLVSKNVIVITFNYRLNAFGFLSLNSPEIPGNQGLRDQVTLLRWVQRNAQAFGGDPDNVTIMGQSAGAACAHLLTLSKATEGLFKRAFLMSGTGISGFYSASPMLAQQLSTMFLEKLGINSTEPAADIHQQLIKLPVEKIHDANKIMLDDIGLTTFVPTVESEFPGVTRILDEDPEVLVVKGRGKDVPLVIGYTNVECEVFRQRLDQINITAKLIDNPVLTVPANIIYTTPPEFLMDIAKRIERKYYSSTGFNTDDFIKYCTDGLYKYPALKLGEERAALGGAPVFLYEFSYNSQASVIKEALDLNYEGAAHIEDLTYLFRANSVLKPQGTFKPDDKDEYIKSWMTTYLTNFMQCSEPVCGKSAWAPVRAVQIQIQEVRVPPTCRNLTTEEDDILQFFDSFEI